MCDLVICASLHAYVGRTKVPRIDTVGACQRLLGDELSAESALEFLSGASKEIEEASSMVAG